MKILKIYPKGVSHSNYNYHINYGVWDSIGGDRATLEKFKSDLGNYDVVFLPMFKKWVGYIKLLNKIKGHKIKTVLFDNDSCYRSFTDSFYDNIDLILYRDLDKNGNKPTGQSMWHPWSVDTNLYAAKYGGNGVLFNCNVRKYPIRKEILKVIKNSQHKNSKYIIKIQNSGAAIHTDSELIPMVRAKAVEFASCGTQIISNRTKNMSYYFPDNLITYFDSIAQLRLIIKNFSVDIEVQKQLREIAVERHDHKVRAAEILSKVGSIL